MSVCVCVCVFADRERVACLAPEERTVLRGQRVELAPLVNWGPWAWWERR